MPKLDHTNAATRLAALVAGVPEGALGDPTPCADYTVGDLLDHIVGLTRGLAAAARKQVDPDAPPPPQGSAANLDPTWRESLPGDLADLAAAWQEPGATDGTTRAGGVDVPAEVVAGVALEELIVHGWDLARATGQPFDADDADLEVTHGFLAQFQSPDAPAAGAAYGPPLPAADGAPRLDQVIALSGRDPAWTP
jgi:uncharacterized protein (TIGR03086 family)